jgi:hypothetical protein
MHDGILVYLGCSVRREAGSKSAASQTPEPQSGLQPSAQGWLAQQSRERTLGKHARPKNLSLSPRVRERGDGLRERGFSGETQRRQSTEKPNHLLMVLPTIHELRACG